MDAKDLKKLATEDGFDEAKYVDKTKPAFAEPEKKTYGRKKMKNEASKRRGFLLENSAWEILLGKAEALGMTASRYIRYLVRKELKLDDIEVREE